MFIVMYLEELDLSIKNYLCDTSVVQEASIFGKPLSSVITALANAPLCISFSSKGSYGIPMKSVSILAMWNITL